MSVHSLPAHTRMTPKEALEFALRRITEHGCSDVVIAGYYEDGEFFNFSSAMTRRDGLWLAEMAKQHALEGG